MEKLVSLLKPEGQMLLHIPMDDMELSNMDYFHFFSHESCMKLMELFMVDIRHGLSRYAIHPEISMDATAIAGTYIGRKSHLMRCLEGTFHNKNIELLLGGVFLWLPL